MGAAASGREPGRDRAGAAAEFAALPYDQNPVTRAAPSTDFPAAPPLASKKILLKILFALEDKIGANECSALATTSPFRLLSCRARPVRTLV